MMVLENHVSFKYNIKIKNKKSLIQSLLRGTFNAQHCLHVTPQKISPGYSFPTWVLSSTTAELDVV